MQRYESKNRMKIFHLDAWIFTKQQHNIQCNIYHVMVCSCALRLLELPPSWRNSWAGWQRWSSRQARGRTRPHRLAARAAVAPWSSDCGGGHGASGPRSLRGSWRTGGARAGVSYRGCPRVVRWPPSNGCARWVPSPMHHRLPTDHNKMMPNSRLFAPGLSCHSSSAQESPDRDD